MPFAGFHMADRYLVMHSCFSTHLNESISQLYENLLEPGTGAWLDTVGWEDRSEFYLGYFFGKWAFLSVCRFLRGCSHITSAKIRGSWTPFRQQWSAFGLPPPEKFGTENNHWDRYRKNLVPKISTGVGAGRKFGYRTLMLMIISLARVWWPFGDTVQMKLDVTQRKTVLKILCSGQKMTRRHSERSWHISTNTRWQRLQKFNPPPLTTWLSAVGCCLVCLPLRQNRCKLEEVNRQLHQWSNWD